MNEEFIVSTLEDENDGDFSQGDLSLREAIALANEQEGEDTIIFDPDLSGGTITTSNSLEREIIIFDSVAINGLGEEDLTLGGSFIFEIPQADDDVVIDGLNLVGGKIDSSGNLTFSNSNISQTISRAGSSDNSSIISRGILNLADSTIADSDGGGNLGVLIESGTANIERSTISNHEGVLGGAGILVRTDAVANITNSTVANNSSRSTAGIGNSGIANITNSTVVNNNGGIGNGGVINLGDGVTTLTSSIIANNISAGVGIINKDVDGEFVSGGNNFIGNGDDATGFVNSDLVGTLDNPLDPQLGELQDNGGTTKTFALLEDSPAIDAGSNPNNLETDQRGEGFDRTVGEATDIGAFEVQDDGNGETTTDLVVSILEDELDGDFSAGDLSLREAIALANEQEGEDTITFDESLSGGTIALTQTEPAPRGGGEVNQDLDITDSVNIIGLGAKNLTIDGLNGGNGIFKVTGQNTDFNLEGLTIANGTEQRFFRSDSGGAGTIDFDGANLTLKDSVIVGGSGVFTGAISNSGNASIISSTITDSSSTPPEGSFASGVISNGRNLEIFNSTISNNSSPGILNRGTLEISNSTISNNNQDSISNNSGRNLGSEITTTDGSTANITSSVISGNSQQDSFDDLSGEFTSGGNNLISDGSGGFVNGENGDLVGTVDNPIDPLLGELQDNGGDTPTQALLAESPAIDAGSNPNNLATDQRGEGFDRTVGEGTDIGAFEVQDAAGELGIVGSEGDDELIGTDEDDTISGLGGNDTLKGLDLADVLDGGSGNDSLEGGARDDSLIGSEGNDTLLGGNGKDTLDGGVGNDLLDGGASDDLLFGLDGHDTLLGSSGRDTLNGGVGNDSIDGGTSDDELLGDEGHDTLIGGNGRDTLNGGSGDDVLTGGNSNDTFVLALEGGHDTITDFGRGNDVIALSSGIGFDDLSFSGHEIIFGDSTLARLDSFDTTTLTQNDFVSI